MQVYVETTRDMSSNNIEKEILLKLFLSFVLSANYFLLMRMSLTVLAATEEDPNKTWWEIAITRTDTDTKPHTTQRERERAIPVCQ